MSVYRPYGRIIIAIPVLAVSVAVLTDLPRGLQPLTLLVNAYLMLTGLADLRMSISISEGEIEFRGYLTGMIRVTPSAISSFKYSTVALSGRRIDAPSFTVRTKEGRGARIRRYGWGFQRKRLFSQLADWIRSTELPLDPRTERALARAHK